MTGVIYGSETVFGVIPILQAADHNQSDPGVFRASDTLLVDNSVHPQETSNLRTHPVLSDVLM